MSSPASFLRRMIAVLLLSWVATGRAHADELNFDVPMETGASSEIRLTTPGVPFPTSGFLPVRVRVVNRSTSERNWNLRLGSGFNYGIFNEVWSSHALTAPANSAREFFIAMPMGSLKHNYGTVSAQVSGPQTKPGQFNLPLHVGSNSGLNVIAIEPTLLESMHRFFPEQFETEPFDPSRPGHRRKLPPALFSSMDPNDWPADWRVWSSFPVVMLLETHWQGLDEPRRQAFLDWAALGGRLVLVSKTQIAEMSRNFHAAGEITTLSLSAPDVWEYLTERPTVGLVRPEFWNLPTEKWQESRPTGWLSTFIVVFGLLVGPVNFFFFAPAGRRQRLFATVPLISLAAIGVLVGMIALRDGFGGDGTRHVLVMLLPERNQAAIIQAQICRTGLLFQREFALPADVLLEKDSANDMSSSADLLRDGDRASGAWFVSRTTQEHSLNRIVTNRERVEIVSRSADGAPQVQSTVGATLHHFIWYDEKGRYWTAPLVSPGTRVTLELATASFQSPIASLTPSTWVRGNFYGLANSGESPDAIATLPSIRWRDETVLYTGPLVRHEPANSQPSP